MVKWNLTKTSGVFSFVQIQSVFANHMKKYK